MSGIPALAGRGSAEALGVTRIVVFGAWLVWVLFVPIERLAAVPTILFQPTGPLQLLPAPLLDAFMTSGVLLALRGIVAALLVAAVLGVRPFAPIGIAAMAGVLVFDSVMKSFQGHVNHAQLCILFAGFLIALSPAADGLSIMGRRRRDLSAVYDFPILATATILTLTYTFVGARRLAAGGLTIYLNDALPTYLGLRSIDYDLTTFDFGLLALSYPSVAAAMKLGFAVVTLAEIVSPLCLISGRLRLAWIAVIVPFHIVTLLTMNIFFWENLLLIMVALTGLPYLFSPQPGEPSSGPIVFYDGECGLCQRSVQWLLRHDPEGVLRYAPLEGETAQRSALPPLGEDRGAWSLVYQEDGKHFLGSEGVLRAVKRLGGIWGPAAALALLVPRAIRDGVYRTVARNRYRLFGRLDACQLPTPQTRDRFLP
ncbi:MAG TPA: DCC1-like thiol-disulfide oxidoreductase family protein [Longimicrobiales bacterium]|nr:DCC1-like thiol-disulfide oxidoreductase family protein [Longimicrobiales bacterium]